MKDSISNRIKVTKTGKIRRRAMALGHSRANKRRIELRRKKGARGLNLPRKMIKNYI